MIGPWEIFMILLVVLLLFGAGRLPQIMGDLVKGIKVFKEGLRDEDTALKDKEKEEQEQKRLTHASDDKAANVTAASRDNAQ